MVKIQGGMGNQLFAYACGYSMCKKYHQQLYLDLIDYEDGYFRDYILDRLDIKDANVIRHFPIKRIRDGLREHFLLQRKYYYKEKSTFHFDECLFQQTLPIYLDGYWQSEKYFSNVKDIKKIYTPARENDITKIEKFENEIKNLNTVAVHIRRGDYVGGGCCVGLEYIRQAIDYILKCEKTPCFIFFSDDMEYVYKNINTFGNIKYILSNELVDNESDDFIHFFCMKSCSHQIISNSTYSWWAAWLNENNNKQVIAPLPKYLVGTDFYPDEWIKIPSDVES